ncbi:TetR/AcrR family transcriptional regulator [Acutalibacter sp. 1XD8-33]|uniref:TetR/AcrR family transcriptional regulator n=1 Tax=Acutalibacter sp. 1XD8-33 TaxID=2320081 RepID=UPI000EA30BFD|nr:helix-turn-helix domain-containing protein [Acutalibacter sp. 1XD8-33]RKJ41140.1 TetR/AcrR family transcriptional regulator [Acutalibacter sp. 1XD8-33]
MRKPQDDLRYQKTEELIQRAFRELMGEMDYLQITIQKLADRARINRKTFYLHYSSVDELLLKMQKQIVDEFLAPIKNAKLPGDLEKVVRNCYVASEKADAMNEKILRSKGRFPVDNQQPGEQELELFEPDYYRYTSWERPYLATFVNMSLGAIYRHWVEAGRKEPMEDMIQLTIRLLSCGLGE